MIKSLSALLLSLLFATQASALVECYSLANGVNGQGSKNVIKLPPITSTFGTGDRLELTFRNNFTNNLNLKVRFYDSSGQAFEPSSVSLGGEFSQSNNPITDASGSGAAFLPPENIGVVRITNTAVNTYTTELIWQADQCLSAYGGLISVSALHVYNENGSYFKRYIPVNHGNVF